MPFNEKKAHRAFQFFTKALKRPDGTTVEPYRPTLWQYECIRDVYGTVDRDGKRQYQTALVMIAKKNGKSDFAAANANYLLCGDGNPDAQIYLTASSSKQTGNVFKPAARMVERSPLIANEYRVLKSTYVIQSRANPLFNRLEVISADGDKNDGFKTHGAVADEIHRWRERKALELWGALVGGKMSAREPLIWMITTAGEMDESPLLWQYYDYAKSIQSGAIPPDPSFYFKLYEADPGDDENDPETWRKANPSLEIEDPEKRKKIFAAGLHPGFLKMSELETLHHAGKYMPKARQDFRRLHLNLWGSKADEECAFPLDKWNQNLEPLRPLMERPCYAGLDLATTLDLTSLTLLFPDTDGTFDLLSFSWMPEERLQKAGYTDKVPYAAWAKTLQSVPMLSDGNRKSDWPVLDVTEGNATDYEAIKARLRECRELFDLREVGFDPKFATQMAMQLTEEGFPMVQVGQTATVINEPFTKAIELVATGKVRHASNPLLTWTLSCARAKTYDNNLMRLRKPERQKDSKRVDPIAAWLDATFCYLRNNHGPSIYETRGVAFTQ